jgi:FAD/FMN-containing dehydrogenase
MTDLSIGTNDGGTITVSSDDLEALGAALRGKVSLLGDPGFDEARSIWNAMVDRKPAAVVHCQGTSDVMQAVGFAAKSNLRVCVRGGGHNIAGSAVAEGALMIDLSQMKSVQVNVEQKIARVEPGATLGDLDKEAQAFGLATPLGINSTTGVAGLTLGGGFGWITRKFGMTIDNLLAADVVTAQGKRLRASKDENSDLFWALRGGGGNFGIVTSFEFQLHDVGPEVLSGLIIHPFDQAQSMLTKYRELVAEAPDELTTWVVLRKAPPLPFLPEEWHGKEVLIFALCYVGDLAEGERAVQPLRDLGEPIVDVVSPHPLTGWQQAVDPLLTPGARNYWKSHDFSELSDPAIAAIIDYAGRLPGPECEIFVAQVGGAMARVAGDATAFPNRDSHFILNVHTRWREAAEDRTCIDWARDFSQATAAYASGTAYVNFMPDDEADRVEQIYGGNYQRLTQVKAKYDPTNFFRVNQNIKPRA